MTATPREELLLAIATLATMRAGLLRALQETVVEMMEAKISSPALMQELIMRHAATQAQTALIQQGHAPRLIHSMAATSALREMHGAR